MSKATTTLRDPVGIQEIAERLGVNASTVHSWRHRATTAIERIPLPQPEATISNTPLWSWATILAWARQTGRVDDEENRKAAAAHAFDA